MAKYQMIYVFHARLFLHRGICMSPIPPKVLSINCFRGVASYLANTLNMYALLNSLIMLMIDRFFRQQEDNIEKSILTGEVRMIKTFTFYMF